MENNYKLHFENLSIFYWDFFSTLNIKLFEMYPDFIFHEDSFHNHCKMQIQCSCWLRSLEIASALTCSF